MSWCPFVLLLLSFPSPLWATETPCQSSGSLDLLKSYVYCQSQPEILACQNAFVPKTFLQGHRELVVLRSLKAQTSTFKSQLAKRLAETTVKNVERKRIPRKPLSSTEKRNLEGFARVQAERATAEIEKHLERGGEMDESFLESLAETVRDQGIGHVTSEIAESMDQRLFSQTVREAVDSLTQISSSAFRSFVETLPGLGRTAAQAGLTTTSVGGATVVGGLRGAGVGMGTLGPMGAALWMAGQIGDATPTACAEIGDDLIHLDRENCEPVYSINQNVLDFLKRDESEQRELLKNPKVCSFYSELTKQLLEAPRFTQLTCQRHGFRLTTKNDEGREMVHHVAYISGSQKIRQINLTGLGARGLASPIQVGSEGQIASLDSPIVAETAQRLKVYLSHAQDCCTTDNDAYSHRCRTAYNGGTTKARSGTGPVTNGRDGKQ